MTIIKSQNIKFYCLLVIYLLIGNLNVSGKTHPDNIKEEKRIVNTYMPLKVGAWWKYTSPVLKNGRKEQTILSIISRDSNQYKVKTVIKTTRPPGGSWEDSSASFYSIKEVTGGLIMYDKDNNCQGYLLKEPCKKGTYWDVVDGKDTLRFTVLSVSERCRMPAGQFKNCLKIKYSYINRPRRINREKDNLFYWAPNVGLIAIKFGQIELAEFYIPE